MENWSPMGTPTAAITPILWRSGVASARDRWSRGTFLAMYTRQATPESTWDRTVAKAAPSTPMPRAPMNRISSTTFTVTAAIRK